MPSKPPAPSTSTPALLARLGECIRARRKALGIAAVAAAEASGVSRTTLHRIEKGEPAVTIGAYANVVDALGSRLELVDPGNTAVAVQAGADGNRKWIPATVRIADYPPTQKTRVAGARCRDPEACGSTRYLRAQLAPRGQGGLAGSRTDGRMTGYSAAI